MKPVVELTTGHNFIQAKSTPSSCDELLARELFYKCQSGERCTRS
jgi:hypothetical protein